MKCVNNLLKATSNKRIGNHKVRLTSHQELYYYHDTPIVIIDHKDKTISIDDGGFKTSSTTRSINSYMRSEYINDMISRKYTTKDNRK